MPTFELNDGRSRKRWTIHRSGAEVTTSWGTIGAPPESVTRSHSSRIYAVAFVRDQIRQRRSKGYVRVVDRRADPVLAHDPRLAAEVRRTFATQDYAVYADFLQHAGDRRGELAALSIAAEAGDEAAATRARELARELEDVVVGPVAPWIEEHVHVDCRLGFPSTASFRGLIAARGPSLSEVLEHPTFCFLRELELREEPREQVMHLARLNPPPPLRNLELFVESSLSRDELSAILAPYPRLERLVLWAPRLPVVELHSTSLVELGLAYGPDVEALRVALDDRALPALRSLLLGGLGAEVLRLLVDVRVAPSLEKLNLEACALQGASEVDLAAFAATYSHLKELRVSWAARDPFLALGLPVV
jgi:predicted DNA-binding WGR domain protein